MTKKQKKEMLLDPAKIREALIPPNFDLNLSKRVAQRLNQSDAHERLKRLDYNKSSIDLLPTETLCVLPRRFQHMRVNVSPYALSELTSCDEPPDSMKRRKGNL